MAREPTGRTVAGAILPRHFYVVFTLPTLAGEIAF